MAHTSRQDAENCFSECLDKVAARFMCSECEEIFETESEADECEAKHEAEFREQEKQNDFERKMESGCY
jgi:hypothetical protein